MSLRTKALLAILTAACLWASAGATAKLLFQEAPPLIVAFQRFFLASLLMFPFFWKAKKPKGYFRVLLPLGVFNAGNILFYYSGLALTTANTSTIIGTAVPLTTTLLSWLIIRETISLHKFVGIFVGLIGGLFIVMAPILQRGNVFAGNIYGNLLLVGSLICWSLYITFSRSILNKGNFSPIVSTAVNIFVVTIATGFAALISQKTLITAAVLVPSYIGMLIYAAIGITVITIFLFQWGVQHVSASTASLKEYIQLVIGIGLNALLLGEKLTSAYLIGGILVTLGVVIATSHQVTKRVKDYFANSS